MSKRRFFNKNQVTAGLSPCLQVDVQPTTPLAVRVPPSEFVSGDSQAQVDRLQQILFYRELGLSLEQIKEIINSPDFDAVAALREHRDRLLEKKVRLGEMIATVEKTIAAKEGGIAMSDQDKFAGLKQQLIEDNENKYGQEVRDKYGDEAVNRSTEIFKNMTQEEYNRMNVLADQIKETLAQAMETNDPTGELAQKAADLHRQWITLCWGSYSKEAHAGLAQMYVNDERFTAYYDEYQPGTAAFLRDAILIYTGSH